MRAHQARERELHKKAFDAGRVYGLREALGPFDTTERPRFVAGMDRNRTPRAGGTVRLRSGATLYPHEVRHIHGCEEIVEAMTHALGRRDISESTDPPGYRSPGHTCTFQDDRPGDGIGLGGDAPSGGGDLGIGGIDNSTSGDDGSSY